jgi:hypothetical protein
MGVLLSNEKKRRFSFCRQHRRRRRYLRARGRKSSKSGELLTGKIIPQHQPCRLRNEWNGAARLTVTDAKPTEERVMYIGLGGILVLILILWLLGVI